MRCKEAALGHNSYFLNCKITIVCPLMVKKETTTLWMCPWFSFLSSEGKNFEKLLLEWTSPWKSEIEWINDFHPSNEQGDRRML